MGAVLVLVRAELRRQWRGLTVVVLLVAIAGSATLVAVAGARRTSSAFDRFLAVTRNQDALVFADDISLSDVEHLRSLPGVEALGYARQLALVRPDGEFLAVGGPLDDVVLRDVARTRIVEGRAPRPSATDEITIPEPLARTYGLAAGDELPLRSFTQSQIDQLLSGAEGGAVPSPSGPEVALRVVGISRSPLDLSLQGSVSGVLLLPRAFVAPYGDEIGNFGGARGGVLFVRMVDGANGVPRFIDEVGDLVGEKNIVVDPTALTVGGVQDSIDVLATGVLVFGIVVALSGLIALALTIGRQVAIAAAGQAAVRDLGLTRSLHAAALSGPVLLAIGAGTLIAVVGAWLASPLLPFGVARRAEPSPGLRFDGLVLGTGAVAMVLALVAMTAAIAWRAVPRASRAEPSTRPAVTTRSLEKVGTPPVLAIGVRMALDPGRGRSAVPVRSALIGVIVAVMGVTAVAVVTSSLNRLVDTPSAFGIGWDVRVTDTRALGVGLGDRVRVQGNGRTIGYTVVGRVAIPTIGDPQAVADGALFTGQGLDPLDTPGDVVGESALVVRFRPGTETARASARIERLPGVRNGEEPGVVRSTVPLEVTRLQQVTPVPRAIAIFLTLLGTIAVAHLLVTNVQRRRREFAILKSIGFRRSQIYSTVGAQATTVAGAGSVVGLSTGVVVGSVLWRATADGIGVLPDVDVPLTALAGIALVTVALANVVAAVPARTAARTNPAAVLRSE